MLIQYCYFIPHDNGMLQAMCLYRNATYTLLYELIAFQVWNKLFPTMHWTEGLDSMALKAPSDFMIQWSYGFYWFLSHLHSVSYLKFSLSQISLGVMKWAFVPWFDWGWRWAGLLLFLATTGCTNQVNLIIAFQKIWKAPFKKAFTKHCGCPVSVSNS